MRTANIVFISMSLAAALLATPGQAAQPAHPGQTDCQQLMELYRACHRLGLQAGSAQTCEESAGDFVVHAGMRAGKPSQSARALAELVCSTGCEDAATSQPPATAKELSEAFCDPVPVTKAQGGRP